MHPEVSRFATSPGDLHDLRAFCVVVDVGSLTEAARLLGETKGAVSRRMKRLEGHLGAALFRRHPRSIEVTAPALALRRRLGPALDLLGDVLGSVPASVEPGTRGLRLTAPPDLGASLIGPLVAAFLARTPGCRVDLVLTERVLSFEAHRLDAAFRVARQLRDSSLVARRLTTLEAALYASPLYGAAHALPREPHQLTAHRLLLLPPCRDHLELVDRRRPSPRRLAVEPHAVADASVLTTLALEGAGIALLPVLVARPSVAAGRLVPVLPHHRWRETTALSLVHRRAAREPGELLAAFRAFAVRWFAP